MVKYFAMALALVATLSIADLAQARGRRGCCGGGCNTGGCPGGVCYVAPTKTAATTSDAPPAPVATAPATQPAAVATTTQSAPTYYASSGRRGLFGWRR
jgi:hypothetical protein